MYLDLGKWQIRSWRFDDKDALVKYANKRKVWINLRDAFLHPYTEKDAEAWLNLAPTLDPEVNFALASRQEAIGGIGLHLQEDVHRRSAGIGYWLGEPFWGLGIARGQYVLSPNTLLPILILSGYMAKYLGRTRLLPGCWRKRVTPTKVACVRV